MSEKRPSIVPSEENGRDRTRGKDRTGLSIDEGDREGWSEKGTSPGWGCIDRETEEGDTSVEMGRK